MHRAMLENFLSFGHRFRFGASTRYFIPMPQRIQNSDKHPFMKTQEGIELSQSWNVEIYENGDTCAKEDIIELLKRSKESWNWQYERNPLGHLIGIVKQNGKTVGAMGLLPVEMTFEGKVISGSQAVDLVVHPEFRRKGIFLAIGEFIANYAADRGIDIFYGFPNDPAHPGHLKYGWFDVYKVPVLIKPMNFAKFANSIVEKRKTYEARARAKNRISRGVVRVAIQVYFGVNRSFFRMFNRDEVRDGNVDGLVIHPVSFFDDRIDAFWTKNARDHGLAVSRSKEYLNWRYFNKPGSKYTVYLIEEKSAIMGYIVLMSRDEKAMRVGYIVDIVCSTGRMSAAKLMILKALEHFTEENVDLVRTWMMDTSPIARKYSAILRANGFISPSRLINRPQLIARTNSPRFSKAVIGDPENWFVTLGDSDCV